MYSNKGFTYIEILTVVAVLSILMLTSSAYFLNQYLPDNRLKNAANQLYLDLKDAQSRAVTGLATINVTFNQSENSYTITNPTTGETIKTVNLAVYQSGVCYGSGPATVTATSEPSAFNDNFITYPDDQVTFEPEGTVDTPGYIYLTNRKQEICYAISTSSKAGMVQIRKTGSESW